MFLFFVNLSSSAYYHWAKSGFWQSCFLFIRIKSGCYYEPDSLTRFTGRTCPMKSGLVSMNQSNNTRTIKWGFFVRSAHPWPFGCHYFLRLPVMHRLKQSQEKFRFYYRIKFLCYLQPAHAILFFPIFGGVGTKKPENNLSCFQNLYFSKKIIL
ncbi:MAG: hypothetical protein JG782_1518 [Anaerophaga sp.]|nr:hypothetical protein [Anaerophaga sp.]